MYESSLNLFFLNWTFTFKKACVNVEVTMKTWEASIRTLTLMNFINSMKTAHSQKSFQYFQDHILKSKPIYFHVNPFYKCNLLKNR